MKIIHEKEKLSLSERAKQAWKTVEDERKERRIADIEKFAKEAEKEFERLFPDVEITSTKAINPSTAEIVGEDVTFIAQLKESTILFYVEAKCQYCDKHFLPEYANNVRDLATIGARLTAPQTCEECKEKREATEHQSTAERVCENVGEIYDLMEGE